MELIDTLRRRKSVRQFKKDPVDDALLVRVLDMAKHAPSWSNTQPYLVALANGAAADALRAELVEASKTRIPEGEHSLAVEYPSPLKERRQKTGYGLYDALGIDRKDADARVAQFQKNFAFFDAPAAMFLFAHEALGSYSILDLGLFVQSILLSAVDVGLATCAQAVLASYPDIVRKHFDVPERYKLVCGIAIGHEDKDAPVNGFQPARLPVEELILRPRPRPKA